MTDRPSVVARYVLQIISDHFGGRGPRGLADLHAVLADLLDDEFRDIRRTAVSEIRLTDE